ncbi:MAG: cyclic nucleotide-binding domain-containing protein [Candidatus Acidiferrales bacterium]
MSTPGMVELTIDEKNVSVPAGTTVFDAARVNGIAIPTLCHQQNENPVGVCRMCVVDAGGRVLTASCVRQAEAGMKVSTNSAKVLQSRKILLELLMADHPSPCTRQQNAGDCELETLARAYKVGESRFPRRTQTRGRDDSSVAIAVDHDSCILCDRCIRGCDETKHNNVLGRMGKGWKTGIAFDLNMPMGNSSCVSCGECMISCPTGALTNKRITGTELSEGHPVDSAKLLALPIFKGVSGTFLQLNKGAVVERKYKAGEVICREGEGGATAYYILDGHCQVSIRSNVGHVKTEGGATGFLSKLKSRVVSRSEDKRSEEGFRRTIPIDAPVDLPYEKPVGELGPGDLFGEMTCMSFYPRSATVQATTDCTMLEMLRNVLDVLQRNKNFREQVDRNYRQRALYNHVRSVPAFAGMTDEFINHLRDRVELIRYAPGQVICRQGEAADSFYLVRIGFVQVSEHFPGGELVLAYIGRGGYFGEIGLLGGGFRTATCAALDHVEVVRIESEDFKKMITQFPAIRQNLEQVMRDRQEENRLRLAAQRSVNLDDFLGQGLMEAQSLLILDLENCTRCDACVRACADAHDGVTRLTREGLRFDHYLVATSCRQCRDPLCMVGCPVGSIRRRNSLEIIIEDWCVGCGLCARNCPYGNITLQNFKREEDDPANPGHKHAVVRQKATSCDLCSEHKEPSCVYACPHDAAHRVDPRVFFATLLGQTRPPAGGQ